MKRIMCLFITLVMLVSQISFVVYAENDDVINNLTYTDSEKLVLLKELGFIPDEYKEGNELITRGEAVSILSLMIKASDDSDEYSPFIDVPTTHPYYNGIKKAHFYKFVSGVGNGQFLPDDPIASGDLQRLAVNLLGYQIQASYKGYPVIVSELKLFKGITTPYGEITKSDFVKLIYNMLHSEYQAIDGLTSNSISFIESDDLFINTFNIYRDRGILKSMGYYSIDGKSVSKDTAFINNETYYFEEDFNSVSPGYSVEFYFKVDEQSDKKTLLHMYNYNTYILTLKSKDIAEFNINEIKYYDDNDRVRTLDIKGSADITINYCPVSPFEPDKLLDVNGEYTFIDNDDDNVIDFINISSNDTYFVASVDSVNQMIYDKRGKLPLDLSGIDNVEIIKNGEKKSFEDIKKNDVVNAFVTNKNVSDSYALLEITSRQIAGSIKSIAEDEEYTIGEKDYVKIPEYDTYSERGYRFTPKLALGLLGMFYFDMYGNIVAVDINGYDQLQYGLFLAYSKDRSSLDDTVLFKIFGSDGSMNILQAKEKIKYNGKRIDALKAAEQFEAEWTASSEKSKLVKYSVNADGLLDELVTIYSTHYEDNITLNRKFGANTKWNTSSYVFYTSSDLTSGNFAQMYGLNSNGVVFRAPESYGTSFNESFEEDEFGLYGAIKEITEENGTSMSFDNTEIYDADLSNAAMAVVIKAPLNLNFNTQTYFVYVNDIRTVLKDDESKIQVTGLYKYGETVLYAKDEELFNEVKEGDILQVLQDVDGSVTTLKIVFRHGNSLPQNLDVAYLSDMDGDGVRETPITQISSQFAHINCTATGSFKPVGHTLTTVYGNLLNRSDLGLTISYTNDYTDYIPYHSLPTKIIVCEEYGRGSVKYREGSLDELIESAPGTTDGSKIMLNTRNLKVMEIVLFK